MEPEMLKRNKEKELHERDYWRTRLRVERTLRGDHYEHFYTTHFGLSKADYVGKRVLDIGCGPRGSLEWCEGASERVGLDPLAKEYLKLGADRHKMQYVAAPSEDMPFPDGHFDFVCSFNSLDHVDDLPSTIAEIARATRSGGLFLLLVDVNHAPTPCEPHSFGFDVVDEFTGCFDLLEERRYEKKAGGMYESILHAIAYDERNPTTRYGILSAKLLRKGWPLSTECIGPA
jgi:SAM-dependent methyltransferase